MNTDKEIIKGLLGYYQNFHDAPMRDLRIMEAKEKSLKFKKNITKKCRRR
mgnify:CR=1 FL=1